MSELVTKEAAFVSYNGNDETSKMFSDAVNRLTHDVQHDDVTAVFGGPNVYVPLDGHRAGDLVAYISNGIGFTDEILYLGYSTYTRDSGHFIPVNLSTGTIDIYFTYSYKTNAPAQRTCVSYKFNGLNEGHKYTFSFRVQTGWANDYDKIFENKYSFGILVHPVSEPDYHLDYWHAPWHEDYYISSYIKPPYPEENNKYYSNVQYYSFPRVNSMGYVSFSFTAYHETYISFVLEDYKSTADVKEAIGESHYDAYINYPVLSLYECKINTIEEDIFRSYNGLISRLGCLALDENNNETYAITKILSDDSNVGYAGYNAPDNEIGENGNCYVQYSESQKSTGYSISYRDSYGWENGGITHDSDGYDFSCSINFSPDSYLNERCYIRYNIDNLEIGKFYTFQFGCSLNATSSIAVSSNYYFGLEATKEWEYLRYAKNTILLGDGRNEHISFYAIDTSMSIIITQDIRVDTTTQIQIQNFKLIECNIEDVWYKVSGNWQKLEVSGGGGGSTVTITPTLVSGTKVAEYSITTGETVSNGSIWAPTPPSIEANPQSSATADLSKVEINGTVYNVPSVEANPQSSATEDLEKVQINGTVYELSSVNANPSGSATGDLEKIEINGVIYELTPASSINGVPLVGNKTSSDLGITITIPWLDYLALPDEDKYDPNKTYYIPDYGARGAGHPITIFSKYEPTSQQGNDGDLYLKYVESLGISAIFGKVQGTWLRYSSFIEYEWDFIKSPISVNNGTTLGLTDITQSSSGFSFTQSSSRVDIPANLLQKGYTYEIWIDTLSITDTGRNNRVFMFTRNNPYNSGFYWKYTDQEWAVYDNVAGVQRSGISDPTYFDDCVLKIVIDNNGKWHIYKNNIVVFEPPTAITLQYTAFALGAATDSCNNMTITKFKIYPNIN